MKTRVNGVELAYEIHGKGEPLVLLHAFPLHKSMWQPQVEEFSKQFQIITPDFRGFGESPVAVDSFTMDLLAADVYALLHHLSLSKVILGGLSMGGYVAFAFYRQHPEMVKALILADTRAEADTEEGKANRRNMAELALKQGAAVIAEQMTPKLLGKTTQEKHPELSVRMKQVISAASPKAIANAQIGMAQRADSTALLKMITCPTLILVGDEDLLTPVTFSENLQRGISNSQLVIIQQAGHLPNLEQPGRFNKTVRDFLKKLSKKSK
jgi:pimeloyl-ACP methyl ester carboxylesterase